MPSGAKGNRSPVRSRTAPTGPGRAARSGAAAGSVRARAPREASGAGPPGAGAERGGRCWRRWVPHPTLAGCQAGAAGEPAGRPPSACAGAAELELRHGEKRLSFL